MTTLTQPLALPDTAWAGKLADAIHATDGARDAYTITLQVTDPDTTTVRIWTRNPLDAADTAAFFNAHPDATATSARTQVWVRHWPGEPTVETITARTRALDGAA